MKKKMFALSGVFLIVLVLAGLWATKAINLSVAQQTIETLATSPATGMSMKEMVDASTMIVIGSVRETRSEWVDGRRLVTLATVAVAETLKGDQTERLTVVLLGGIDPKRKLAMTYPGAPTMSQDEEVALFLGPDEVANGYSVVGYSDGKFSIAKDSDGEKLVKREMTRVPVQKGVGMTRGNPPQAIPLSEFKALVQSYLNK